MVSLQQNDKPLSTCRHSVAMLGDMPWDEWRRDGTSVTVLRIGELLGLRWRDVDLDAGRISVRQTCQWLPKQGFIFRQPKTHRSARPVTVAKGTVERLRQHR